MCPLWCTVKLVPGIGSSLRLPQVTSVDIASYSFCVWILDNVDNLDNMLTIAMVDGNNSSKPCLT